MENIIANKLEKQLEQVEQHVDGELERLKKFPDENELESIRRERITEMKKEQQKRQDWITNGHGEYTEIDEPEFFKVLKNSERVVIHYYRNDTFRCKIMDKHLKILAQKYVETRFVKLNVEKANFLVTRFNIRVLPMLSMCKDELIFGHIIGFDTFGGHDEFKTEMVAWRLGRAKMIFYKGDLDKPPAGCEGPSKKDINERILRSRGMADIDDSDFSD